MEGSLSHANARRRKAILSFISALIPDFTQDQR